MFPQIMPQFLTIWVLVFLMSVIVQVLFALAVYNDAKAKGNSDATLWALLVGFLGLIPGIIYLCLRGNAANKIISCPNCHFMHPITMTNCPQCGAPNYFSQPFYDPMIPAYRKKAKNFLIAGIVCFAVAVILFLIFMSVIFTQLFTMFLYFD